MKIKLSRGSNLRAAQTSESERRASQTSESEPEASEG